MTARLFPVVAVVVLIVLAGCIAAPGTDGTEIDRELGVVDGIAYDDPLDIDASDGLDEAEQELVIARAKARVEYLRGLPFVEAVEVDIIARDEFDTERIHRTNVTGTDAEWENAVWRALFHVDEETDVRDEFDAVYSGAVLGYYEPANERVVLITDDPERALIDRNTLAHELLHALQHQHFGLATNRSTMDRHLAGQGLIEGDANYVEYEYNARCASGEWQCLERPPRFGGAGPINLGLFVTIFHPYSDGPSFVAALRAQGGWAAVNDAYDSHPATTTEIIHPDRYAEFDPEIPRVTDESSAEWSPYMDLEHRDDPGTTVGEAALFATFWANGVVDRQHLYESPDPRSPYLYAHEVTTGWRGDRLVPYHDGGDGHGFVFVSTWDSRTDAITFAEAYRQLLYRNGAEATDADRYRISDDAPFQGAYAVERDGRMVTVVHAPTEAALGDVYAPIESTPPVASEQPSPADVTAAVP